MPPLPTTVSEEGDKKAKRKKKDAAAKEQGEGVSVGAMATTADEATKTKDVPPAATKASSRPQGTEEEVKTSKDAPTPAPKPTSRPVLLALAAALKLPGNCPRLATLRLHSFFPDGEQGMDVLAEAMRAPGALQSLTELDLSYNPSIADEGIKALAQSLRLASTCPRLATLSIKDTQCGAPGVEALASAMSGPDLQSLTHLDASSNSLPHPDNEEDEDPAAALARKKGLLRRFVPLFACLAKARCCPRLAALVLVNDLWGRDHMLGQPEAECLASAISQGGLANLTDLSLKGHAFEPEGVKLVLGALKAGGCPLLSVLLLAGTNDVGNAGLEALAQAMKKPGAMPKLTQVLQSLDCDLGL